MAGLPNKGERSAWICAEGTGKPETSAEVFPETAQSFTEKLISCRLLKNAQMEGARNPEK